MPLDFGSPYQASPIGEDEQGEHGIVLYVSTLSKTPLKVFCSLDVARLPVKYERACEKVFLLVSWPGLFCEGDLWTYRDYPG